jgi:DNA-binding PucR family transcriptional regulator
MTDSIYPQILTSEKLEELTDNKLSKSRASEIKAKVNELQKDLARYKKLRKKWKRFSKILHGIGVGVGVVIGGTAAGLAIAATEGILIPASFPIALAIGGAVETAISESVAIGLIKKKKHKFTEKINIVSLFMNKMYLFYHHALEDKKISIDELEEFHKLVNEYESEIDKLQTKESGDSSFQKLQHRAEVQAKKECEKEMLEKLTEQKKNDYKTKFSLN